MSGDSYEPRESSEWHWIITMMWSTPTGGVYKTVDGRVTPPAGMGRQDLYHDIKRQAEEIAGQVDTAVVYFSLEPNQLGVMNRPAADGYSQCSVCLAQVHTDRAEDHAAWHDDGRGRFVLAARRLLRHLADVALTAVVAREGDTEKWTLLLGVNPQQSYLSILQRIQAIARQEGIPIMLDQVVVTDVSNVEAAARSGGAEIGSVTLFDAVPLHAEQPS